MTLELDPRLEPDARRPGRSRDPAPAARGRWASGSSRGSSFRVVPGRQSELGELPVVRHIRKHVPSVSRASRTPKPRETRVKPRITIYGTYSICWLTDLCDSAHVHSLNVQMRNPSPTELSPAPTTVPCAFVSRLAEPIGQHNSLTRWIWNIL